MTYHVVCHSCFTECLKERHSSARAVTNMHKSLGHKAEFKKVD